MKELLRVSIVLLAVANLLFFNGKALQAQSSVDDLTNAEAAEKIRELDKACDASPGCIKATFGGGSGLDGPCLVKPYFKRENFPGSDLCDYSVVVFIQKYKPNGDPVCVVKTYTWDMHCID